MGHPCLQILGGLEPSTPERLQGGELSPSHEAIRHHDHHLRSSALVQRRIHKHAPPGFLPQTFRDIQAPA